MATSLYFGASALMSGGATAGAGSGVSTGLGKAATSTVTSAAPVLEANAVWTAPHFASTGMLNATQAGASKSLLHTLAANPGLASGGLMAASGMANASAERADAKDYQKKIEENNKTQLNVLEDTRGILERTGYYSKQQQGVAKDANGQSVYQQNAAEQRQRVAPQSEKPQKAFNQATNTWEDVLD